MSDNRAYDPDEYFGKPMAAADMPRPVADPKTPAPTAAEVEALLVAADAARDARNAHNAEAHVTAKPPEAT